MKIAWNNIGKISFYFFSALTILVPSLLAGYRDTTVGHDLNAYMVPLFETLEKKWSISYLIAYIYECDLESGFVIFNYLVKLFTDDIFWAFFIQEIVVLTLVYSTCYRLRRNIDGPLFFFIYMFTMFCTSMSMARQVFAVDLAIFAYPFVFDRKWKPFIAIILLASFMHHSAVFVLPLYLIVAFYGKKNKEIPMMHFVFIVIYGCGLYLFFPVIIEFLIKYGIIASKYIRYADQSFNTNKVGMLYAGICFFISFNIRNVQIKNEVKVFSIIVFFVNLCGVYNDVAMRIALYYLYYLFLRILMWYNSVSPNEKKIFTITTILLMSFVFVFYASKYGYAEAVPYTSKTLGI